MHSTCCSSAKDVPYHEGNSTSLRAISPVSDDCELPGRYEQAQSYLQGVQGATRVAITIGDRCEINEDPRRFSHTCDRNLFLAGSAIARRE